MYKKISDIELAAKESSSSINVGVAMHGSDIFSVMDISSCFTDELFSGIENQRGSILVEVKCTVVEE